MHEYDITLKNVLRGLTGPAFRLVTGADEVVRWPNVELPELRSPRVDMLGETATGGLVHIELQSTNDPNMALRMLEYAAGIRRAYGRFPAQVVLYAGRRAMRMSRRIEEPGLTFHFRLVDVREIDGEALLSSPRLEDNIVAVLARLADQRSAVRLILHRIAASQPESRAQAMKELEILAGLRNLGSVVAQEVAGMPILDDIMDHDFLGPKIREGMAAGRAIGMREGRQVGMQEGRQEGMQEGMEQGERQILRRLIEKRFGPVPGWANRCLEAMPVADVESVAVRLLDAASLEDLLGTGKEI